MDLSNLYIDVKCMGTVIDLSLWMMICSFIWNFMVYAREIKKFEIDLMVEVIRTVKWFGYGALAFLIHYVTKNKGLSEIDILSFFTFMLACFETIDNISGSIIEHLAYIIGSFFRKGRY